jgi:hypothetical protein
VNVSIKWEDVDFKILGARHLRCDVGTYVCYTHVRYTIEIYEREKVEPICGSPKGIGGDAKREKSTHNLLKTKKFSSISINYKNHLEMFSRRKHKSISLQSE